MFKTEKILVPTDFTEFSDKALKKAKDIAETFNAEIFLLHVIPEDIGISTTFLSSETLNDIHQKMEKESMKAMEEQVKRIIGDTEIKINYVLKRGIPYHEILNYEEEAGADLVVIASHSKSKLEEAFFGSTTEKVVRRSKVSVFVVRD